MQINFVSSAIFAVLLLKILSNSAWSSGSAERFGSIANDQGDDTLELVKAFNGRQDVYVPDGKYRVEGNIAVGRKARVGEQMRIMAMNPGGTTLFSESGAVINLHHFSHFGGFKLENVSLRIHGGNDRNSPRIILDNEFLGEKMPSCVEFSTWYGVPKYLRVENNRFAGCRNAIYGSLTNSDFVSNSSVDLKRHYNMKGANEVNFTNNVMTGGIVGILFLARHGGGPFTRNTIEGNTITSMSEEGISFDMAGNESSSYSRWSGIIDKWDSNSEGVHKVYSSNLSYSQDITPGSILVFIDDRKPMKGTITKVKKVTYQVDNIVIELLDTLPENKVSEGDRVVNLSYLAAQNTVSNNTLNHIGKTAIALHGLGTDNEIINNSIYCGDVPKSAFKDGGGIVVKNIINAGATQGKYGPTYYNKIHDNRLRGNLCDLRSFTKNYGGKATYYSSPVGNTQFSNVFSGGAKLGEWE